MRKRNAQNVFEDVWQIDIDPGDYLVHRESAAYADQLVVIEQNGDPATKVDLLMLGDGYTAGEHDAFIEKARELAEALFSTSPFKERRSDFNIWAIAPATAQSGVSRPSTHTYRDTLIGATYDAFRSEHGITLIEENEAPLHLPTEAQEVFDVTGAGDTVIATLAAVLAAGDTYAHAAALANVAAGLVVAKRGTATVTRNELEIAVEARGMSRHGIFTEDELERLVTTARQRGQKVVMTNGCFDILHAGHVAYLKEARALGDRLIVAVNSDDSTRRLKGENRPVNRLADRMTVLAALEAVDWVVPFEEDTPERLICRVLPNVLVKGGDYKPEDIAGSDCVAANGGEVRVLKFHEGRSSSSIIEALEDA